MAGRRKTGERRRKSSMQVSHRALAWKSQKISRLKNKRVQKILMSKVLWYELEGIFAHSLGQSALSRTSLVLLRKRNSDH